MGVYKTQAKLKFTFHLWKAQQKIFSQKKHAILRKKQIYKFETK